MFHKFVYTCVFIALHSSAVIQTAERRSSLEIYNVTCFKYTERIKSIECEFHKFAINRYGISMRMMFNQDLVKPVHVRIWADIMPKDSKRAIRILDVKLNACTLLKELTSNQFLKPILAEFKRTSNVPTSCQFKGNVLYRQDNSTVTADMLLSIGPMFNCTYRVELFERNKLFGGWQILGAKIN